MIRAVQRGVLLMLALSACSAGEGGRDQPGKLPGPWQDAEPLSCESYSLDATAATVRYDGQQLPELAGGELAEGLYRRMYTLTDHPAAEGAGVHADEQADALLFANGRVLWVRFDGAVGTYEARGKSLQLEFEQSCDSETGETSQTPASRETLAYGVDDKGHLSLAGMGTLYGAPFNYVAVYRKVDDLCERGNDESYPEQPGADSWHCLPELIAGGFISCSCKVHGEYAITRVDDR